LGGFRQDIHRNLENPCGSSFAAAESSVYFATLTIATPPWAVADFDPAQFFARSYIDNGDVV
jgi:hypothetical protein